MISSMNMFDEIDTLRTDLPKLKSITDEFVKHEYNSYQIIALVIMTIGICVGVIFGNVFPACGSTSGLYSNTCLTTEFNFSLTIAIWMATFLICVFLYGMGTIISLLTEINKNLHKKTK